MEALVFAELGNGSDGLEQLGTLIRTTHDGAQQEQLLSSLTKFIDEKEEEIETMCKSNYQDFVKAVDKLLRVRQGTVKLRERLLELNADLQASGKKLAQKKRDLFDAKRSCQNLDEALDALYASLRVLDLAKRVNAQIEEKKHYAALRSLDDLQSTHLKHVLTFDFARHMNESIPAMQKRVKQSVIGEMKEWLFDIRNNCQIVGRLALDQMEQRQSRWKGRQRSDTRLRSSKVNTAIELVMDEQYEYDVVDNDQIKIDFRPLYHCIHIYDTLDSREELQKSYQDDRYAQANLILSQGLVFDRDLAGLNELLEKVVGFFVVEKVVLKSVQHFRSEMEVDDLWDNMCEKIVEIVSQGLEHTTDPEIFLKTKVAVRLFIETLEGYGFSIYQLNNLLMSLFRTYSALLRNKFRKEFKAIVAEDDFVPMTISNTDEFAKVVKICWLEEGRVPDPASLEFPVTMPFSQIYPFSCVDIRSLVAQYYEFAEGSTQNLADINTILRKTLDEILISIIGSSLKDRLKGTNLSQIVQIVINAEHFEMGCAGMDQLLSSNKTFAKSTAPAALPTSGLQALSVFQDVRKEAERRIFELVNLKIDDFFELADYDWCPRALSSGPSMYLQEMVGFLSTVISETLHNLPLNIRGYLYSDTLDHIVQAILALCTDSRIPVMNEMAISNLDIDLSFLEQFIDELNDPRLRGIFAELRQIINLVRSRQPELFIRPEVRTTNYGQVKFDHLLAILEKLLRSNDQNSSGGYAPPMEMSRRKGLESICKAIKQGDISQSASV